MNKQEQLCDMNDELQETARETELELREALDLTNAKLVESQRRTEAFNDAIGDYQNTILKFRDLVAQQQNKIKVGEGAFGRQRIKQFLNI